MKKLLSVLIITVALVASPLSAPTQASVGAPGASADDPAFTGEFLSRLNTVRASFGLPGLVVDDNAVRLARDWSVEMASTSTLAHRQDLTARFNSLYGNGWTAGAENIGVASDRPDLDGAFHNAFLASAHHRANMLGNYTHVGVGVVVAGSTAWITVNFVRLPNEPATTTMPPTTGAPTTGPTTTRAVPATTAPATTAPATSAPVVSSSTTQPTATTTPETSAPMTQAPAGDGSPAGTVTFGAVPGGWKLSGVAADPDTGRPIRVRVTADGKTVAGTAAAGTGGAWTATLPSSVSGEVCAVAVNRERGGDTTLGCRTLHWSNAAVGRIVAAESGDVSYVVGWVIDPDVREPLQVWAVVGDRIVSSRVADIPVTGLPGWDAWGADHGFVLSVPATAARVCVTVETTEGLRSLGCRSL